MLEEEFQPKQIYRRNLSPNLSPQFFVTNVMIAFGNLNWFSI